MLDFEVQRCTRRCHKTERELQPGETYYSVLVSEGAQVTRYDYCQPAWEGPPQRCVAWWKSRMPEANAKAPHWAPNDVMLDYFEQLQDQPGKEDVRYVLALLLVRRRLLRLDDTLTGPAGREELVLFCARNEAHYQVPVVLPDEARAREIQNELAQLLTTDTGPASSS